MKNIAEIGRLVQACGSVQGRVKLQKMVHILQELGFPFREKFGYLHHGPYSSELKREIDQLVDWGLVMEKEQSVGDYIQYEYSPTQDLESVLNQIGFERIPAWHEPAELLNTKNSKDLEGTSTIMFLQRRGFEGEKLQERFGQLKPHLEDRFEYCLQFARDLRGQFLQE